MKRVASLLFVVILSAFVFSVFAQEEDQSLSVPSEKSKYGDNWFISLGGNANLLIAEQDQEQSVGDRLKYGGAFTVGKWFNPNFGMRVQVMGGNLRGFNFTNYHDGAYLDKGNGRWGYPMAFPESTNERLTASSLPVVPPKSNLEWEATDLELVKNGENVVGFWQDFNYALASVDYMANLTNLFRGHYRERSPLDIIAFMGVGYIHAFDNKLTTPDFNYFVAKAGLRANINLNPKWALYLEPQLNATSPEFDGYSGDAMGDGIINLSFGVQYTFNRDFTASSDFLSLDEIDYLNDKINDNRRLIENHQDILERQQNLLNKLDKCCDENGKEVIVTNVVEGEILPEYVRFVLDSYEIEQSEYAKIVDVVKYLKTVPDSKLFLVGYADKNTGNPSYNLSLSQKRVQAVTNELTRLGISPSRLVVEWKGDKVQPFAPNDWNRVVVMVERK